MSSQRGNVKRQRPQKHQNKTAFKNTMHDTSNKTKIINSIQPAGCCSKCKDIIEWRIKFKKYKLLSQPKKCVKCEQKTVKKGYCTICDNCAKEKGVCVKCGQAKEIAVPHGLSTAEEASQRSQLENELKFLTERQRRTFKRLQESGQEADLLGDKGTNGAKRSEIDSDLSDSEDDFSDNDSAGDCDEEVEPKTNGSVADPDAKLQSLSIKDSENEEPEPSASS